MFGGGDRVVPRVRCAMLVGTSSRDPPRRGSSAVGRYGFVSKDLRRALRRHERGPYARRYCGRGSRARCRNVLVRTLKTAITIPASTVYRADGVCRAGDQRCFDSIRRRAVGGETQPLIDWINRPTFQQANEIRHSVPR